MTRLGGERKEPVYVPSMSHLSRDRTTAKMRHQALWCARGLEDWDDFFFPLCLSLLCFFFGFAAGYLVLEVFDESLAAGDDAEFSFGSELAVGFVFDDVGDCLLRFGVAAVRREVEASDLEAVEQEAGALGVDGSGGDAEEDFADSLLDGGAVFRVGKSEGGGAGAAGGVFRDAAARFVVVVAELLSGEARAAAAAAVGVDVAALIAFGF